MNFILRLILIMSLTFYLNISTLSTAAAAPLDTKPPETLVYYNAWPGDHESPLDKDYIMSPLKPINVYTFKNTDSSIIKTIQTGEFVTLITADYHAYPSKSQVVVLKETQGLKQGDIIYLMSYIGGGDCLAWYDNEILWIPAEGIEGVIYYKEQRLNVPMWAKLIGEKPSKPDLWLRVRTADFQYGWIKYDTSRDWKRFGSSIFIR